MNDIITINKLSFTYNVDWHTHKYTEVIYCTRGHGQITLRNGSVYPYRENDFIIISPNIEHKNTSTEGFENIYLMSPQTEFFVGDCAVAADTPNRTIYKIMSQTHFCFHNQEFNTFVIRSTLSTLLFNCIAAINKSLRLSKTVDNMRAEIIRNYADPDFKTTTMTVNGCPVTESMHKSFKKQLDVTPLQFLIQTRISHAKQLLASRRALGMNVTEICQACGFDDVLYFSRVFKKACGVSPLIYAESLEKEMR